MKQLVLTLATWLQIFQGCKKALIFLTLNVPTFNHLLYNLVVELAQLLFNGYILVLFLESSCWTETFLNTAGTVDTYLFVTLKYFDFKYCYRYQGNCEKLSTVYCVNNTGVTDWWQSGIIDTQYLKTSLIPVSL